MYAQSIVLRVNKTASTYCPSVRMMPGLSGGHEGLGMEFSGKSDALIGLNCTRLNLQALQQQAATLKKDQWMGLAFTCLFESIGFASGSS